MIIAPSILSMDFSKVEESMQQLNLSKATWLHFDVMDGHFVPNLTFGPDVLRGISKLTDRLLDCHLMISDPEKYAFEFIKNGAQLITFHSECFQELSAAKAFIQKIKDAGIKVGITSKPATDIHTYDELLPLVDLVLVMSVEPGFGGQSFMMSALDKISYFARTRQENGYHYLIEVDGGINEQTAPLALEAGVDILVAGSYVFKGDIIQKIDSIWKK